MANTALTISMLSQIALSAGLDMGFNAAEVERWYVESSDALKSRFTQALLELAP